MMNGTSFSWKGDMNYPVNIWGALPPIFFACNLQRVTSGDCQKIDASKN